MSTHDNKPIIKKSKEILTRYGYDVKTAHLYELFSELAGYKDRNTAAGMDADFKNVLAKLDNNSTSPDGKGYPEEYLKDLMEGKFADNFLAGQLESGKINYLALKNIPDLEILQQDDGAPRIQEAILFNYLLGNSSKSLVFLVDPLFSDGNQENFSLLRTEKKLRNHVIEIFDSKRKIIQLMQLLLLELKAREELFLKEDVTSLSAYERKSKTTLTRIIIAIDNADVFWKFDPYINSTEVLELSHKYGVRFLTSSPGSKERIYKSSAVGAPINQYYGFIRGTKKRAYANYFRDSLIYPEVSAEHQRQLLSSFIKPISSKSLMNLDKKSILEYFDDNPEKLYRKMNLNDLVKDLHLRDSDKVVAIIHETQGHKVESLDSKLDPYSISHVVEWNNGVKVAVMNRHQPGSLSITEKHIHRLNMGMQHNHCTHGIIYTSSQSVPSAIYQLANANGIEIVDLEDFKKLAYSIQEGSKEDQRGSPQKGYSMSSTNLPVMGADDISASFDTAKKPLK